MTKQKPGAFALSVIASVGYIALLTFANTYVMGLIVDRIQASPVAPDGVFSVFGPYILALLIVNAVGQMLSKLQDYAVYKLEINGNYQLSRLCFDTLSNQSMTFHTGRFGGSLVSQTSRFVSGYSGLVDVLTYSLWPTLASVILTIAMLAPAAPTFVLILIAMLVVYVIYAYTMYRKILPLSSAASQAQNRLSGILSDAATNILAVKTCGREDFEHGFFDEADREAMGKENVNMHATMKRGFTTSALITIIMFVTSIFVSGGNAWFGISAGTLVMMFTYTYNLTMRFNYFNSMMQRINRALGDAAAMTKVLDEPTLVADRPDAAPLQVKEGGIRFEHIRFRYADAPKGSCVFEDLNLDIAPGQRVGLVGRSGSGKTTLAKLLLRLSDVQEGRILIDGQDVSACTQRSLRRQVAYVPQEPLLFHRSIRENIAYGRPEATEEEIRQAAAEANALEFIERLPPGPRYHGRRARRQALGRTAPARGDYQGHPCRLPDPRARRDDKRPRQRVRGTCPGSPRKPHARPHLDRGGPPPLHRGSPRPHRRACWRQGRGGWHTRRACAGRRCVRRALEAPDRRLPRDGMSTRFNRVPLGGGKSPFRLFAA